MTDHDERAKLEDDKLKAEVLGAVLMIAFLLLIVAIFWQVRGG